MLVVVTAIVGAFASPRTLSAQAPVAVTSPSATLSVASHARYRPFACSQAAVRAEQQFWRALRPDTLLPAPLGRTLEASTIDEIQDCVAPFTVRATLPRQLIGLGQAYLAAGNDAKADSAFKRVMQTESGKSVELRAWTMSAIVISYVTARPVRIAKAMEYAALLDVLGAPAAIGRLRAHNAMYRMAKGIDSLPLMETESRAALQAHAALAGDARRQWAPESNIAFQNKADLEGRRGDAKAAITTLQRAAEELRPLRPSIVPGVLGPVPMYTLYGKPARALRSMFVASPGQSAVRTTSAGRPTTGKTSLVVFVGAGCDWNDCFFDYATLRRLIAKYAAQGLEVTLVTHTAGWNRDHLIKDPAEEVQVIQNFFHNYVKIPATIVIWKTDFEKHVDGSLHPISLPNDDAYTSRGNIPAPLGTAVLIDKTGIIRQSVWLNPIGGPSGERRLDNMIGELLK